MRVLGARRDKKMLNLKQSLVVFFVLSAFGCFFSSPPSDISMEEKFRSNEAAFNRLVGMMREDSNLVAVDLKAAYLLSNEIGDDRPRSDITAKRIDEYHRLLKQIGVNEIGNFGGSTTFKVWETFDWMSSEHKNYLYIETLPSPLLDSLNDKSKLRYEMKKSAELGYKKIADNWYLEFIYFDFNETDLTVKQKNLRTARDEARRIEIGRQAVGRDSMKRKFLDELYKSADASVRLYERQSRTIEANLAKKRAEETYWVNQLHLIRDYIDEKCPKVPKLKPPPTIPNIAGNNNSLYGETVLTQERKPEGVFITATVYYNGGDNSPNSGTSRLSGFFDGKTWVFSWRNTFGNYGTGAMGYNADGSLSGYWLNSKDKSRGNWWLRQR